MDAVSAASRQRSARLKIDWRANHKPLIFLRNICAIVAATREAISELSQQSTGLYGR